MLQMILLEIIRLSVADADDKLNLEANFSFFYSAITLRIGPTLFKWNGSPPCLLPDFVERHNNSFKTIQKQ